jgi:hypothetical protein
MQKDSVKKNTTAPHRIEVSLREMNQLFNTMDPSPFREKDLDDDAEEFILGWAREFPVDEPLKLIVHLKETPPDQDPQAVIQEAVHHYFRDRARLNRLELRRLMKEGRQSLVIGLVFLAVCLVITDALAGRITPSATGTFLSVTTRESLTIGGWVAMWRPMQIYLYEWWPIRRRGRVFEKLSRMPVEVRKKA